VDWIFAPDLLTLWYVFSALFGGGFVFVLLAGCSFFVLRGGNRKTGAERNYVPEKLSIAWAFVPVLLLFVFSVYVKPVFVTRFFAWIVPGVALFICLVMEYAGRNRPAKTAVWFLLLGIFGLKSGLLFRTKGSGFKESVSYLNSRVKPGETVLIYPYFWALDINFYLDRVGAGETDARPVPLTKTPYLAGGGGLDPDPDWAVVENAAKRGGMVYLFCNGNANLSKSDSNQKRTWLPRIQQILAQRHPVHREIIFGPETQCPIKIIMYE